jgi:hypothetical protein
MDINDRLDKLQEAADKIMEAREIISEALQDAGICERQAEAYTLAWLRIWAEEERNQIGSIPSLVECLEDHETDDKIQARVNEMEAAGKSSAEIDAEIERLENKRKRR